MAEHDGKVVFDLEIDDSHIRSDLSKALNQVKSLTSGNNGKIHIGADTSAAVAGIKQVGAQAEALTGPTRTINVDADANSANSELKRINKEADDVTGPTRTINVDANADAADTELNRIDKEAEGVTGPTRTINVDANANAADSELKRINNEADEITGPTRSINVDALTEVANEKLITTAGLADGLERTVTITVNADTDGADNVLKGLTGGSSSGSASSESGGLGLGGLLTGGAILKGGLLGKLGAALGGAKLVSDVFQSGKGFDYGLAQVSTLMPEYADKSAFSKGILALSQETGDTTDALLAAAYNALSGGVSYGTEANGQALLDFVGNAARTGVAGFTDTDTALNAIMGVKNAYGGIYDYSDEAISNMLLKGQERGIMTVGQQAQSVAQITGPAALAHVPWEQAGAMWSTITNKEVPVNMAATQIAELIKELNHPGTKGYEAMTAALKGTEYSGMSLPQIMDAGGTMVEILDAIQKYGTKNNKQIGEMFNSQVAANAVGFLTGTNLGKFQSDLDYNLSGTNVTQSAYATMADTTQTKVNRLKGFWDSFKIGAYNKGKGLIDWGLTGLLDLLNNPGAAIENLNGGINPGMYWNMSPTSFNRVWSNDEWMKYYGFTPIESSPTGFGGGRSGGGGGLGATSAGTGRGLFVQTSFGQRDSVNGDTTVADMQSALTKLGYFVGEVDGIFGTRTQSGVKEFQKSKGLEQTGELDAETAAALAQAMAEMEASIESANASAESVSTNAESVSESLSSADSSVSEITAGAEGLKGDLLGAGTSMRQAEASARRWASYSTTIKTRLSSAASAMSGLGSAIASLISAANNAASKASAGASISAPKATAYAVGLDRVPYDNYPALLHKGEMVLTAAQASSFRNTSMTATGGALNAQALKAALTGMAVEIDGQRAGMLLERSVSTAQGVRLNRMNYRG